MQSPKEVIKKRGMSDSQRFFLKTFLINNFEDIIVFFSINFY